MYALLAIALSLSPQQQTDDNLLATLRDKFSDRLSRMQSNNVCQAHFSSLCSYYAHSHANAFSHAMHLVLHDDHSLV